MAQCHDCNWLWIDALWLNAYRCDGHEWPSHGHAINDCEIILGRVSDTLAYNSIILCFCTFSTQTINVNPNIHPQSSFVRMEFGELTYFDENRINPYTL